jgi:hypothetical protein
MLSFPNRREPTASHTLLETSEMKKTLSTAAVLLALTCAGRAGAEPITYTESVNASGQLGSTHFTNALFTIIGTADSNSVTEAGGAYTVVTSTTFSIAGVGSGTITDVVEATDSQTFGYAGFLDITQNSDLLLGANGAFDTYDLMSAIGPLGTGGIIASPSPIGTTDGTLLIEGITSGATFTAAFSTVPEPSSLVLFGLGLTVTAVWGRSKNGRSRRPSAWSSMNARARTPMSSHR